MNDPSAHSPPPLPEQSGRRRRAVSRLLAIGLLIAVVGGIAWVIFRPPAVEPLFPKCVLYQSTGLYCPGCGGTRAVDALLHGHVGRALASNPITTLALPLILAGFIRWIYKLTMNRPGSTWSIRLPRAAVYLVAGVLFVFMILRNIPHPIFDLFRPPG